MIYAEELQQVQPGKLFVDDDGEVHEITWVDHAGCMFGALVSRQDREFKKVSETTYWWDKGGRIYNGLCARSAEAPYSEKAHFADAVYTAPQVIELCREKLPVVATWTEVERFELHGGVLQPYRGGEILPHAGIHLNPSLEEFPELADMGEEHF